MVLLLRLYIPVNVYVSLIFKVLTKYGLLKAMTLKYFLSLDINSKVTDLTFLP